MTRIATCNDWKNHPMPEQRRELRVQRRFSEAEMELIRRGMVPECMEDKWFLFFEDNCLFCHLSWTGSCVFTVEFAAVDDGWEVRTVTVNRDPHEYQTPKGVRDGKLAMCLIDALLLGKHVCLSNPSAGGPGHAALQMWAIVGRVRGVSSQPEP